MFGRDPTDACFAKFCRTGDPEALGEVFDRTSGRLMKAARWLTRAQADAEDVLQRTFLQAIEARGQFKQGSAAMPWLLGLLGNQARKVRSDRSRSRVEGLQADQFVSPQVEVATSELELWLQKAAKEMGEPYGEVLRLHFEQGLNAKEIAAFLDRPAGTVRTQLMRGLAHVRDRIPVGFVANNQVIAMKVPALHGMRAALLSSASSTLSTASVAAASGVLGTLAAAKWFLVVPLAAASMIAWALPFQGIGVASASTNAGTVVVAQGVEEPTKEDLKPTGDADLDELRKWAVNESIEFLMEKRLVFVVNQTRHYRNDHVLWWGIQRLCQEVISNPDCPNRKMAAASMAQIVDLADQPLRSRLEHLIKPLRDIRTMNTRR